MTRSTTAPGALALIEEAVHRLRQAPPAWWAIYYAASLPFVLALLYFWADTSQNAVAPARCADAALGVTALYLWMKCGQAIFVAALTARLRGEPPPRWTARRLGRLALVQITLQPTGLILLPLAFLALLPFGWVYAFYHQVTAVGDGTSAPPRVVARQAARLAGLWPRQNYVLMVILSGFGFFVLANVLITVALLPELLRLFLGIETSFTLSGLHLFNSTFLATVVGVTWLCLNPLLQTVYALRTFYGESIQSGADLLAELRSQRRPTTQAALLVLVCVLLGGMLSVATARETLALQATSLEGERPASRLEAKPIAPGPLDEAIAQVLQRREFAWRLPSERSRQDLGPITRFVESLLNHTQVLFRAVKRWIKSAAEWLWHALGFDRPHWSNDGNENSGWIGLTRLLGLALTAIVLGALVMLAWRVWQRRRGRLALAQARPLPAPGVDVADENVGADQLPVDGWLREAQNLLARGELRLALRALYLAGLAQLAARELIVLAKSKSNRDYRRELERRAHAVPGVTEAFAENIGVFEGAWYGEHAVTPETIDLFRTNLDRLETEGEG